MRFVLFLLPLTGRCLATTILAFIEDIKNTPQVVINEQLSDARIGVTDGFNLDLDEERLVQFMEGQDPVVMTELQKIEAKANGINFFDVTDTPDLESFPRSRAKATPSYPSPRLHTQVTNAFQSLSTSGPRENLEKFTSFWSRYYLSESGRESQKWLFSKVKQVTDENVSPSLQPHVTVQEFKHSWGQNTIIARINGSSEADGAIVILGAHLDTFSFAGPDAAAPGADDDGSGTVTILESYRALLVSGFVPERTVEFHWYAAEGGGRLGSQAVVQAYAARSVEVHAMTQFDMTAWVRRGTQEEVGLITDYTDPGLTDYLKRLIETYLHLPWAESECGYACSDHASWHKAGFPAGLPFESSMENCNMYNVGTNRDRIDHSLTEFSFDHMLQFSKLGVALAMELSTI